MSHNPNTIESQHQLSTTNDGKRSSNVLLSTIEKLENLEKQLRKRQFYEFIYAILGVLLGLLLGEYIEGFIRGVMK